MTSVPETMKIIADDVQLVAKELIRLLLRKTIRPSINPISTNSKVVYNTHTCRYERGLLGSTADDNVNKYNFSLTFESLGWTDDIFVNFRTVAKIIQSSDPINKFPSVCGSNRQLIGKARVAFSDRDSKQNQLMGKNNTPTQYNNLVDFISNRSMRSIIGNKSAAAIFVADLPYSQTFKMLESIGQDIIDQTNPCINSNDSSQMSTAILRTHLYTLDQHLAEFSVRHPDIFQAYIELLKIINSIDRKQIDWVINIIAALTYQRWEELSNTQQKTFLNALGEEFVNGFVGNPLITILLQTDSELILTSAYLYPVLKMLFVVFNYSKLTPRIIDSSCEKLMEQTKSQLRKYFDRKRGAFYRRGDHRDPVIGGRYSSIQLPSNLPIDLSNIEDPRLSAFLDQNNQPHEYPIDPETGEPLDEYLDCLPPEPEPNNIYTYEFIKLFGELYPTLIGLMGGTEEFPPDTIQIELGSIPPNYGEIDTLSGYLWRFNDYSYCEHIEYLCTRQLNNSIRAKVCEKVRYLQTR